MRKNSGAMSVVRYILRHMRVNKMKSCPTCNSSKGLREIIYGMPDDPVDEARYVIGGCCISDNDPTIECIDCGWKGEYVDNINPSSQILEVVELPDMSKMSDAEIKEYAKTVWKKLAKKEGGNYGDSKS
jgi:hypothetical protein